MSYYDFKWEEHEAMLDELYGPIFEPAPVASAMNAETVKGERRWRAVIGGVANNDWWIVIHPDKPDVKFTVKYHYQADELRDYLNSLEAEAAKGRWWRELAVEIRQNVFGRDGQGYYFVNEDAYNRQELGERLDTALADEGMKEG